MRKDRVVGKINLLVQMLILAVVNIESGPIHSGIKLPFRFANVNYREQTPLHPIQNN